MKWTQNTKVNIAFDDTLHLMSGNNFSEVLVQSFGLLGPKQS